MADSGWAFITFDTNQSKSASRRTIPVSLKVKVISYALGYMTTFDTITVTSDVQGFPMRTKQNDFQFSVQCHSQIEYDYIRSMLVAAQRSAYINPDNGVVRFSYPDLKLDYLGYITQVPAGARRFEVAPILPLSMLMIRDNINMIADFYSVLKGRWSDVLGTSIVDLYNANAATNTGFDEAASANPPPAQFKSTGKRQVR